MCRTAERTLRGLAAVVLLASGSVEARAQRQVGHVARIAETRGRFVDASSRGELWQTGGLRAPIRREAPLRTRDILRLRERVHVELRFQTPPLETNAYLGSQRLSAVGSYEILTDSVGDVSRLQLVVRQGVLVVEHARGGLLVFAAGIRTRVIGTTALFAVDSGGTSGTLFVQEGHIAFPDYGIDAVGANRAWRLQAGRRPVELVLAGPERSRLQNEVKYTTESVWRAVRPWWQRPAFYVPALAGAGVSACAVAGCFGGDGGGGTAQGGVAITIPE